MKKAIVGFISVLTVFALAIGIAACGNGILFAGTYKFKSLNRNEYGLVQELEVGDILLGFTVTEDYFVLELEEDGSAKCKFGGEELLGTWETADGKNYLIFNNTRREVTVKGRELTLETDKIKLVLKRV